MKFYKFISISFLFCFYAAVAQTDSSENPEELFSLAREKAFRGAYDSARTLLKYALKKNPDYSDVRIFLARTYAWEKTFTNARNELQTVLNKESKNPEALSAAIDVELWDHRPSDALSFCLRALRIFPNDEDFLLKKARILRDLQREDEALITVSILEDINPSNPEIPKLRESIKSSFVMQSISVNETFDSYSKIFNETHLLYLQYSRATYFGTVIGRFNYRIQTAKQGIQGEIEAYPRIFKGVYAYVNYGYAGSASSLFPEHRGGLELFFKLPSNFEGSFGARYLYFRTGSDVTIYTGSAGYYYKDYWFSLRPYITPNNLSFSRSVTFTTRWYYNGTAEEYFSLKAGAGFSPDERNYDPADKNLFYLKAQTIGAGWQKPIGLYSLLTIMFDYTNQELSFSPGEYVKVYSLSAGYRYKF